MQMTATGLVYGEIYLKHDTGPHHPERAQRLTAIFEALEVAGLLDKLMLIKLTRKGYAELTRRVKNIAEVHAQGRLVSVLEGGYNLKALGESVQTHIQVLMEMEVF